MISPPRDSRPDWRAAARDRGFAGLRTRRCAKKWRTFGVSWARTAPTTASRPGGHRTSGGDLSLRALSWPDQGDVPRGGGLAGSVWPARKSGVGLSQCAAAPSRGSGGASDGRPVRRDEPLPGQRRRLGLKEGRGVRGFSGADRRARGPSRGAPSRRNRLSRRRQGPMAAYRLDRGPDLVSGVGQTRRLAQGPSRGRHRPRPFRALLHDARGVRHAAHATPIICANSRP